MRHVLVTGASGAIGSALVPLLSEDPETQVTLLLRASSDRELGDRLVVLRRFWGKEPSLIPVRGDVCEPWLGLGEADHARLASKLTHIVHAAGNVRLNSPLPDARRDAVTSLENVLVLARRAPRLQKLDLVSTVGVAGRMPGLVLEARLPPRSFRNTYEQAKAEAEELALASGLPLTIHRPSMVVGDSVTGRIIRFQVFYYLCAFLSGRLTNGLLPDTGTIRLDTVPVDHVARMIGLASGRAETAGRIFHLCAGPQAASSLASIADELRSLSGEDGLPPLVRVPLPEFHTRLPSLVREASPERSRALGALPPLLDYLDDQQAFDNRQAVAFAGGLAAPPLITYLRPVMAYYRATRGDDAC